MSVFVAVCFQNVVPLRRDYCIMTVNRVYQTQKVKLWKH